MHSFRLVSKRVPERTTEKVVYYVRGGTACLSLLNLQTVAKLREDLLLWSFALVRM